MVRMPTTYDCSLLQRLNIVFSIRLDQLIQIHLSFALFDQFRAAIDSGGRRNSGAGKVSTPFRRLVKADEIGECTDLKSQVHRGVLPV